MNMTSVSYSDEFSAIMTSTPFVVNWDWSQCPKSLDHQLTNVHIQSIRIDYVGSKFDNML